MEESSILKLIMEKGPREGETLEFRSGMVVKIGRVLRGNTIGIKDGGISSKHLSIQFDDESGKWTLSDLESSNGTVLNGINLRPNVPSVIKDGDCIKIGELTSIIVKIEVDGNNRFRRNPRRQGKAGAAAGSGFGGDLGETKVEEPIEKRNLRSRAKKAVDSKNEVGGTSSRKTAGNSKKEKNVNFNSTQKQIAEDLSLDEREVASVVAPVEGKKTRGGKRGRRKKLSEEPLENVGNSVLSENVDNIDEFVRVGIEESSKLREEVCEGKEATVDENPAVLLENVDNSVLEENQEMVNESVQVDVGEELKLREEGCKGKEAAIDENPAVLLENVENSVLKENHEKVNESVQVDVVEELKLSEEGCKGKEAAVDENPLEPMENVENSILEENLENINESVQFGLVEELKLRQEVGEGEKYAIDESSLKADIDKGKEVEELGFRQDGCECSVKNNGPDICQGLDLEKMTLGEFFNYLEVQLPKEIYDKTEKIISDLREKACRSHEFRLQRIEKDNGKLPVV